MLFPRPSLELSKRGRMAFSIFPATLQNYDFLWAIGIVYSIKIFGWERSLLI